jgi:hypothetical protein
MKGAIINLQFQSAGNKHQPKITTPIYSSEFIKTPLINHNSLGNKTKNQLHQLNHQIEFTISTFQNMDDRKNL